MSTEQAYTCCFTGHRPDKLPWGYHEQDPRCLALKGSILRELEGLYRRGWRHFISGMAQGCDLYFAEAVLTLKATCPGLTLEAALPFPGQADRWPAASRARWHAVLEACDTKTIVSDRYDRWCMLSRDRYMVDRSSALLAVFSGSSGGTKYTLDYAAGKGLELLLLDPASPAAPALRMTREGTEQQSFL